MVWICTAAFVAAAVGQNVRPADAAATADSWNGMTARPSSLAEERIALNILLQRHPDDAQAWTQLGQLEGRLHQFSLAEKYLRHALMLDPNNADAHYLLGLSLVGDPKVKLDWPGAIDQFQTVLRLRQKDANAAMYMGVGLSATGRYQEAVQELRHAVELDSRSASAWFNLALAEESVVENTEAATAYRRASALRPGFAAANSGLGKLLLRGGDVAGAVKALRQALAADPDLQDAHYALGQALRAQRLPEEARAEFEIALALAAREPDGIASSQKSNAAMAQAAAGDLISAEAMLREAIGLRPDYGVPHYNLGLILADRQQWIAAVSQLAQAASLTPAQAGAWFDLGRVLRASGRGQEALQCLGWAEALAPSERTASELRSTAAQYGLAVPANPTLPPFGVRKQTPEGFLEFADELRVAGDPQGSIGMLLRALELDPTAVAPRLELAAAYQTAGKPACARQEYRKVLDVDAQNQKAQLALQVTVQHQ